MQNKKFLKLSIFLGFYFAIYVAATVCRSEFWGNILSPVGGFLAFLIIFHTFLSQKPIQKIWVILSLGCLAWAVADGLWAIDVLILGKDPADNILIAVLYALTNIAFFSAMALYALDKLKNWNVIQLIVDFLAVSISISLLLWIVFFEKNHAMFELMLDDGPASVIAVVLDIAVLTGVSVWYCSIRGGRIPAYLRIIATSLLAFSAVDLYWFYLYLKDLYIPNSIIDAFYMAALLGVAVGIKLRALSGQRFSDFEEDDYTNVGIRHKGFFLLGGPVLAILIKGFNLIDTLACIVIFLGYESLSVYIQASIKNEELLKREKSLNSELERRIEERTRELVEKNRQLDFLSNQDTVTNLYNRRYFLHMLQDKLEKTAQGETLALLFIDIDRFKIINDTYGHCVGDKVLIEVSKRLAQMDRKNSFLARLGGDEFVFAFQGNYGYEDIEEVARHIIDACSQIIEAGRYSFHLTISIGISIYPFDAFSSDMLMKNADMAMYQAKRSGHNKYISFNSQLHNAVKRRNAIEMQLKRTDFDEEFMLFYQPQYSLSEKKLVGMEALLRWNSRGEGLIPPGEFIPIAEENDLIIPIGNWVMKTALQQISVWNNKYGLNLKMGINVSPKQLDQSDFMTNLSVLMEQYLVSPEWVDIEITEGVAMEGEYRMSEIARQFKSIGVSVSIDDFGTGYSSLSYLKLFPFDRIKIAKPLIDAIETDRFDRYIIKFITLLAKVADIQTIAEGVETKEQFDLLARLGCGQIQGYFLGKPVPAPTFEQSHLKNAVVLNCLSGLNV